MINTLHLRLFEAECIAIDSGWNTRHVQSSFWRFYRNGSDGASLEADEGIYFTRVFARQTGVTPAAYRKASRV